MEDAMLSKDQDEAGPVWLGKLLGVLIFLIVALFVLGLILSAFFASRHPSHHRSRCIGNLKQLWLSCALYSSDYAEAFPPTLGALHPVYASVPELFVCSNSLHQRKRPLGADEGPVVLSAEDIDYCYVSGLTPDDLPDTILAFDEESHHGGEGTYVLTLGGGVRWEADLDALHARLTEQAEKFRASGREVKLIRPPWSR
jgi:hypothetical protein